MTQLEFEWGTPIVVMGRRKPDWLMNEVYQFRFMGHPAIDWRLHEAHTLEPNWDFVEAIRLPAIHKAYSGDRRRKEPPVLLDTKHMPLRMSDEDEPSPAPVADAHEPAGWAIVKAWNEVGGLVTPKTAIMALARYIERHETAPVDPDVLAVRAIVALYCEGWGGLEEAQQIRDGLNDDGPAFQRALEMFRTIKANGGVVDVPSS